MIPVIMKLGTPGAVDHELRFMIDAKGGGDAERGGGARRSMVMG
jgi:hypothetical protein